MILDGSEIKTPKFQFAASTCLTNVGVIMVTRKFYGAGSAAALPKELVEKWLHGDFDSDHGPILAKKNYPVLYRTVANTDVIISVQKPEKGNVSAIRVDGQYRHSRSHLLLSTVTINTLGMSSTLLALYKRLSEENKLEVATECLALIEKRGGDGITLHQKFYNDILQEAVERVDDPILQLEYIIDKAIYIATDAPKATTNILKVGELCNAIKQCFAKNGVGMVLPYSSGVLLKDLETCTELSEEQKENYRILLEGDNSLPGQIMQQTLGACFGGATL
jgi:hypothetical protein